MNRRDFLKNSGALVVAFSSAVRLRDFVSAQGRFDGPGTPQLDSWVAIASDGSVTAYTGKVELGHGLYTAQTQLVAEELSVPLSRVRLIQGDTAVSPDQGTTSGSQSHPVNFNDGALAQACATAREELTRMAAARLGVPADQLVVRDGVVSARADGSKRTTYGELIGGRKFNLAINVHAKRKNPLDWTVLGTPVPRLDAPALAAGTFEFVHNVRVPGMLHGRVVRPPEVGATLVGVDEASVKDMPGFVKVVVKKNFVGVVAQKPWQATQIAARLRAEWTKGTGLPPQRGFYEYLRNQKPVRDTFIVDSKDVDQKMASASRVVKATYLHAYNMHGSIGTSCAVADVQGDKATIWSPTQSVYPTRNAAAMLLDLKPENVHVVFTMGSGCYGLNGADTVSYDAALMSQAVGRPVRVQLSRRDEMAWENYGTAFVIDQRVALDASGGIVAWDYEAWSPTLGGRPGYNTPGNVVTGFLTGAAPQPFTPRSPAPEPAVYANNLNAAPSYVTGAVGGRKGGTGNVGGERVLSHSVKSLFWTGPLRSPERLQNSFAHESMLDEVAALVKADPVAYRLRHLSDPRLIEVVNATAQAAKWETRPSPKPAIRETGVTRGRGIACVLYEGNNGYCALVADVEVNQDTGKVTVKRFVAAQDCGPISNPGGLKNQLEGGVMQGMSRALGEEVTWDQAKITSVDWRTYRPVYLGDDVPEIESILINRPGARANGAGETAITVVAGAIGNAIFDATGARVREAPFTAERVKAALAARTRT
jgi:CO/xanthine dehydrogenase Mo-binding subunit